MAADFFLGESLVGDGNEVAHIDLIIGSKTGPAGASFCNALANNKDGFTTLLAVVSPNLPCKPDTLLFNKVTIKGAKQAVQMFGPAQAAVARAVVDSVESGVISKDKADDLCILVGVFIRTPLWRVHRSSIGRAPIRARIDPWRAGSPTTISPTTVNARRLEGPCFTPHGVRAKDAGHTHIDPRRSPAGDRVMCLGQPLPGTSNQIER